MSWKQHKKQVHLHGARGAVEVLILSLDAPCHATVPGSGHRSCWLLINTANDRNLSPTQRYLVVDMVSHWKVSHKSSPRIDICGHIIGNIYAIGCI